MKILEIPTSKECTYLKPVCCEIQLSCGHWDGDVQSIGHVDRLDYGLSGGINKLDRHQVAVASTGQRLGHTGTDR